MAIAKKKEQLHISVFFRNLFFSNYLKNFCKIIVRIAQPNVRFILKKINQRKSNTTFKRKDRI